MALVYVTDDEINICRLVAFGLKDEGFETEIFTDGNALLEAVQRRRPDAVILDWMMPAPDGLAVCRTLRSAPETRALPILMLTAKSSEIDRVLGLEMGADDYIVKPFSMKELCARVRAVMRRTELQAVPPPPREEILEASGILVDIDSHTITKNGNPIELTAKEFDLLVMLMKNKGRVLTRNTLLDKVWGMEYFGDTRTVDVHVRYLRQKIEDNPESPALVQTVRGVGYKFSG
ncbi:MAG: response regulator transcription factor [Clostridiales bacterium]|nr:response regulator transcription factor [Clostridiales bacterium]